MLLNVPPDCRGLIHENDRKRLKELGEVINHTFAHNLAKEASAVATETRGGSSANDILDGNRDTYWAPEEGTEEAVIEITLPEEIIFDHIILQEYRYGQRVESFELNYEDKGIWRTLYKGTVIGYKKICAFHPVASKRIRFNIIGSRWCPVIFTFEVYKA